jgi:invasion protein IalB
MKHWSIGILVTTILFAAASSSFAQEASTNAVATYTDWTVYVETDPVQCWVASVLDTTDPSKSQATRDGQQLDVRREVRRDTTQLVVSYWPQLDRRGEVSFTGGYVFAPGSTVTLQIGEATFEMFTVDEMAWAASAQEDQQIVTAMKRGADAVLTARSARGTQTKDTFSLIGFTAAVEDADARCSG